MFVVRFGTLVVRHASKFVEMSHLDNISTILWLLYNIASINTILLIVILFDSLSFFAFSSTESDGSHVRELLL